MKIIHGTGKSVRGWSPELAVEQYSGSEILLPTQSNFPALKHFWDMHHISGAVLLDTVGTQHVTADAGRWFRNAEGFAKWEITGGNYAPASFEAPGGRDFMLIGCGRISWKTRASTIGGMASDGPPYPSGIAFDVSVPPVNASPNAYLDASNYTETPAWSFADDFPAGWVTDPETLNILPVPANPGIVGCFATVISPSAGTCKSYWAGRVGQTATYDPIFEEHTLTVVGNIQGTWGELGDGWTMFPGNRFEWVALMYFENGAPLDMQDAMQWMAQHNDIRLYPGWMSKM